MLWIKWGEYIIKKRGGSRLLISNVKKIAVGLCISFILLLLFFVPVLAADNGKLIWVPAESEYLDGKEIIRVALVTNKAAGEQDVSADEISVELFNVLGIAGGIGVEYIPVSDYEEALQLISDGQADVVVSSVKSNKLMEVEQSGILRYAYHHPIALLGIFFITFVVLTVILLTYIRARVKRQSELHGYEKSYRMLADTFGQAGIEYDFLNDRLTVFGERHGAVDIPETIERLHEKLKRRALRITLTADEFDELCTNKEQGKTYQTEFQCGMKGGGWNWFSMIYIVTFSKESNNKPMRLVGCLMDAQKQHQTQEKLVELGQYDKLTGTFNRTGAEAQIVEALENLEEYSQNVFLLMDVDKFKHINDSYGHLCGDDVLRVIGQNVNEIFQGDTIICRWGGDEFTMLVRGPGAEEELLNKRIEELRRRMKEYRYEGKHYPIGLSIGGVIPADGMSLEELFKQADDVLYEVKERGRDNFLIRRPGETA